MVHKNNKVYLTVHKALRDGNLKKEKCIVCPARGHYVLAHHEDYNRPLDVVWICGLHHMMLHKIKKYLKNKYGISGIVF